MPPTPPNCTTGITNLFTRICMQTILQGKIQISRSFLSLRLCTAGCQPPAPPPPSSTAILKSAYNQNWISVQNSGRYSVLELFNRLPWRLMHRHAGDFHFSFHTLSSLVGTYPCVFCSLQHHSTALDASLYPFRTLDPRLLMLVSEFQCKTQPNIALDVFPGTP